MRSALLGLLLLGCKSGSSTFDTRSFDLKSKALKVAMLKDFMASPTVPDDVEFHLVLHGDSDFKAAVKIKPDDVPKWADGCIAARLEVRPSWVEPLLRNKLGWSVSSQPDTYRCGREERVIHVHEGVIFRRIVTEN